jgi:hypothetical protein
MNQQDSRANTIEKNRIRNEIEAQVQNFLQQGGKIDIIGAGQTGQRVMGQVWHGHDELNGLGK